MEVTREHVKPQREWSSRDWLDYLEGWSFSRLQYPKPSATPPVPLFQLGAVEAMHAALDPDKRAQ